MNANNVSVKAVLFCCVLFVAAQSGCSTFRSVVFGSLPEGGEVYSSRSIGMSMVFPAGWRIDDGANSPIYATKEGNSLNVIYVSKSDKTDPLMFTHKTFQDGMLPVEVAEALIAEERSQSNISGFTLTSNRPVVIDGCPGCRIEYRCTFDEITYHSVCYGFVRGDEFFRIQYTAPERFYFQESIAAFEKTRESIHLRK